MNKFLRMLFGLFAMVFVIGAIAISVQFRQQCMRQQLEHEADMKAWEKKFENDWNARHLPDIYDADGNRRKK